MRDIREVIDSLSPEKDAVFMSGDLGISTMQEELRKFKLLKLQSGNITQREYENPNGVFLRFSVEGRIHSGIIQAEDTSEIRGLLYEIPPKLHEEGVDLLTIRKTPLDRIPLFPFFTILSKLDEPRRKLRQMYWARFKNDTDALRNWYQDFLKFRREIVNVEAPQLEPAISSRMGSLKIYVLYNEKDRLIATRYYHSSENEDTISVKKTSESVGLKAEKAFSNAFDLPQRLSLISEQTQFSKEGEKVYSNWDHPYFFAAEDIKKQVEKFNRAQPSIRHDANYLSHSLVHSWTHKEIAKIRELAKRFPTLEEALSKWLKPVQVLLFFFIDNPVRGRVTDGTITAYYVNGPEDRIIVKRVKKRTEPKIDENSITLYLPESKGKAFYWFKSSVLFYLDKKLGTNY